jgi:hypothetical protein
MIDSVLAAETLKSNINLSVKLMRCQLVEEDSIAEL